MGEKKSEIEKYISMCSLNSDEKLLDLLKTIQIFWGWGFTQNTDLPWWRITSCQMESTSTVGYQEISWSVYLVSGMGTVEDNIQDYIL